MIMVGVAIKTYTIAEFETMPDEGRRWELVNGQLVERGARGMPGANEEHCRIASRLHLYLGNHVLENNLGDTYVADARYNTVPGTDTVRLPDVSFVESSRVIPGIFTMPYSPDLAVEIVSDSNTFNEIENKVSEYLSSGAKLVWVISPNKHQAYVYQINSNQITTLGLNDQLDGDIAKTVPGFKLQVRKLFRI
jgi:Uma2 family endonuclease